MGTLGFLLILAAALAAAAQPTRRQEGLKGSVRQIDRFEIYFCCSPNARRRGPRRYAGRTTYNKDGTLAGWISVTNDSNGSYYERREYRYEGKRLTTVEVYRSDKTRPETYFEPVRGADGTAKLSPETAERLTERIAFTLDRAGRIVEEVSRDPDENLIYRRLFSYDAEGRMIRATFLKENGVLDNESIVVHMDGGLRSETTGIRPGADVFRSVLIRDREGRVVSGDQYGLKAGPDGKTARYVLKNRSRHTYDGMRETRMDWTFYGDDELPRSKVVILWDERGEEGVREEMEAGPLPPGSRNEDVEPAWNLRERTVSRREYDRRGNQVKLERRQQYGLDGPLELTTIYESEYTYW